MQEIQSGLWHWTAPHPEWEPDEPWDPKVSSYALDNGEEFLLFDPLAVPDALLALASERQPLIVLSAPWHERDAQGLVARLGAPVYTPSPDSAEDLMRMFQVSAERAGDGSPDLKWLLRDGRGEARLYAAGDPLPGGIQALPGHRRNDHILWIEDQRAILSGDTLVDFGEGLQVNERWLLDGMTREKLRARVRRLLDLPFDRVLLTHGGPRQRRELEQVIGAWT